MAKKRHISRRGFLKTSGAALFAAGLGVPAKGLAESDSLREVTSVRIYPGIGIARIGNSQADDGFFIGPEVTEISGLKASELRDTGGALKRQAARFRVYGFNSKGDVVAELNATNSVIHWSAHLANKKAQWYRFTSPLDVPESKDITLPRRNPTVTDRQSLVIDPGPRDISGVNQPPAKFDGGHIFSIPVDLGELRTDELGRLLVLGGTGKSASPTGKTVYNENDQDSFNNADGWYDDIADGPVRAIVQIDGRALTAEPAWVVVAPPNYAPHAVGWRTMYDLMVDVYTAEGWLPTPPSTSFTHDVLPILSRLTGLQWVNQGFASEFGALSQWNFEDADLLAKIADPYSNADLRKSILNSFRWVDNSFNARLILNPDLPASMRLWPMQYGDSYGSDAKNSPNKNLQLDGVRLLHLKRWASGQFIADWQKVPLPPKSLDEVPLERQPDMLTKAALHFCLADAFHPGCEMTWPMRHASLYRAPGADGPALLFRIRQREVTSKAEAFDFGETLNQATGIGSSVLGAQGPGDLSKWMALPWQGDTAFCRSGYDPDFDPYLLTFWPARVPNQVLSEADFKSFLSPNLTADQRRVIFQKRESWTRNLSGDPAAQMMQMIEAFPNMGIVEPRELPEEINFASYPKIIFVESQGRIPVKLGAGSRGAPAPIGFLSPEPQLDWGSLVGAAVPPEALNEVSLIWQTLSGRYPSRTADIERALLRFLRSGQRLDKLSQAGWTNLQQMIEFHLVKMRNRK